MKLEFDRIWMEIEEYKSITGRWDVTLIQFVSEMLGKDTSQEVRLS